MRVNPDPAARQAELAEDIRGGRVRRLLLVRHGRLGENMFWTAIPTALRRAVPEYRITVLTVAPAVWEGHPDVERVLAIPASYKKSSEASALAPLQRSLREMAFDAVLVGREPPGLMEMLRGLGVRHHLEPSWFEGVTLPSPPSLHNGGSTTQYHAAETAVIDATPLGASDPPWPMRMVVSDDARAQARERLRALGVPAAATLITYNVGTDQTTRLLARRLDRSWPVRHFVACARRALETERERPLYFFLSHGSRRERCMAAWAVRQLPRGRAVMFPARAPIGVVAGVLQESACLLTCDTGLLHIASALEVPTLALFGPRARPERTGPYLLGERAQVLAPASPDGQRLPCAALSGEEVAVALERFLTNLSRQPTLSD